MRTEQGEAAARVASSTSRGLEFGITHDGTVLRLPVEPSEKLAVVGLSGSGKSFFAGRLAEEWMMAGVKVAVIDEVGTWFGLRSGYDGDPAKGFPVNVVGGQRMDRQLRQPKEEAELFVKSQHSTVYDLSAVTFETLHWFVANFLNRIGELGPTITRPFVIIFEETPVLCPQMGSLSRFQRDCRAAMSQCARVYRNFGVGMVSITQRAAVLDKTVLSSAGTLVAFRIASRSDRKSLQDWASMNSTTDNMEEAIKRLAVAPVGTGMIWSPSWGKMEGVAFKALPRSTYHPDPRRLLENRSVRLCAAPTEHIGSAPTWRSRFIARALEAFGADQPGIAG